MQGVCAVWTAAFAQAAVFAGAALLAGGAPRFASFAAGLAGALAIWALGRAKARFGEQDFWALALAIAAGFAAMLAFVLFHEIGAWPRLAAFAGAALASAPLAWAAGRLRIGAFAWARAHPAHWMFAAACFAATAAIALAFHYPAPYFDEWDLVALYEAASRGALRLGDLFTPHGTHWHASAYAVLLPLARLTGMAHGAEIAASLGFALAAAAALQALLARAAHALGRKGAAALVFSMAAFFLFSADQIENWLWGWQVAVFINVAGALTALALLADPRGGWAALAAAMLAAAAAIYAFATGLALLPIGLIVLVLARRRFDAHAILWLAFSLAVAGHYARAVLNARADYVQEITPHALGVPEILRLGRFALEMLGAAVGRFADTLPLLAAGGGLAAAIWALARIARRDGGLAAAAGPIGVLLYGGGAALLIAYGRLGFENPHISRYITFANFFWIAVIALSVLAVPRLSRAHAACLAVLLACKLAVVANVLSGGHGLAAALRVREAAAVLCRAHPAAPEGALRAIAGPEQGIASRLAFAHAARISLFRACPR